MPIWNRVSFCIMELRINIHRMSGICFRVVSQDPLLEGLCMHGPPSIHISYMGGMPYLQSPLKFTTYRDHLLQDHQF